ncbi:MAG: hypothetical protein HDS65_01350 [Bacteroidales bacterium]|nr:hypothetical protein [Bacteroidales bacterium]
MIKKLLAAALIAIPALAFVSCSDDDKNLPDVDFNVEVENATKVDGAVYVVQGETLTISGITVTNREEGKEAAITQAAYFWDGRYIGTSVFAPYGIEIPTSDTTPLGNHSLDIQAPVLAVDKEVATAVIGLKVVVVESEDEVPGGGSTTFVATPTTTQANPK